MGKIIWHPCLVELLSKKVLFNPFGQLIQSVLYILYKKFIKIKIEINNTIYINIIILFFFFWIKYIRALIGKINIIKIINKIK